MINNHHHRKCFARKFNSWYEAQMVKRNIQTKNQTL